jgi:hypothetical protein
LAGIYRHSRRSGWVQKTEAEQAPAAKPSSKWSEKSFFGDDDQTPHAAAAADASRSPRLAEPPGGLHRMKALSKPLKLDSRQAGSSAKAGSKQPAPRGEGRGRAGTPAISCRDENSDVCRAGAGSRVTSSTASRTVSSATSRSKALPSPLAPVLENGKDGVTKRLEGLQALSRAKRLPLSSRYSYLVFYF